MDSAELMALIIIFSIATTCLLHAETQQCIRLARVLAAFTDQEWLRAYRSGPHEPVLSVVMADGWGGSTVKDRPVGGPPSGLKCPDVGPPSGPHRTVQGPQRSVQGPKGSDGMRSWKCRGGMDQGEAPRARSVQEVVDNIDVAVLFLIDFESIMAGTNVLLGETYEELHLLHRTACRIAATTSTRQMPLPWHAIADWILGDDWQADRARVGSLRAEVYGLEAWARQGYMELRRQRSLAMQMMAIGEPERQWRPALYHLTSELEDICGLSHFSLMTRCGEYRVYMERGTSDLHMPMASCVLGLIIRLRQLYPQRAQELRFRGVRGGKKKDEIHASECRGTSSDTTGAAEHFENSFVEKADTVQYRKVCQLENGTDSEHTWRRKSRRRRSNAKAAKGPDGTEVEDWGGTGECGYLALMGASLRSKGRDKAFVENCIVEEAEELRRRCAQQLEETKEEWRDGFDIDLDTNEMMEGGSIATTVEEFITAVRDRPKRWVCSRVISVAAVVLEADIVVFEHDGKEWRYVATALAQEGKTTMHIVPLLVRDGHFVTVNPGCVPAMWREYATAVAAAATTGTEENAVTGDTAEAPLWKAAGGADDEDRRGTIRRSRALGLLGDPVALEALLPAGEYRGYLRYADEIINKFRMVMDTDDYCTECVVGWALDLDTEFDHFEEDAIEESEFLVVLQAGLRLVMEAVQEARPLDHCPELSQGVIVEDRASARATHARGGHANEKRRIQQCRGSRDDDAERRVALAWWMRYMCNFRDHFANVAVAKQIDAAGGDTIYMALVIKANPHNKIVFIRLHEVISPSVAVDAALSRVKNKPQHQKVFSIGDCKFFTNDSVPIGGDDDVWVYRNLHLDGDIVISNHAPEPFETYVRHLPLSARAAAPPSSPRAKRAKIAAGDVDKLLVEFPWLTRDDLQRPIGAGRAAGAAARAARPGAEEAADAEPAEEPPEPVLAVAADEDEVWEELGALREEFHNPEEAVMQFYTRINGGAWTAAHCMVVANGVSMFARGGLATTWAKKYKWPKMKSYAYAKHGQVAAHQLASEMVRRSQHFYVLWESSEDDVFVYSVADLKSYEVSVEWVTFLTEQPVDGVIFEQGILINALVPQNPP
jgi:hypothetical protein